MKKHNHAATGKSAIARRLGGKSIRTVRPAWQPTFTLALRVLATGQRLRADEAATATTFMLRYTAQRVQEVRR